MILWIIACIACFVLGDLKGQAKLKVGAGRGGEARGVVLAASRAAPATPTDNGVTLAQSEVSPTSEKSLYAQAKL